MRRGAVPPEPAAEPELAMDLLMAEAVLQFGSDLREARDAASAWCRCDR